MKIKIGDKVRFLNDVGGGVVTQLNGKDMVTVLNEDDFEVPVLIRELVKISSAEQEIFSDEEEEDELQFTSTEEEVEDDEPVLPSFTLIEGNDELNLYLAILPEAAETLNDSKFKLYLINDSNYQIKALLSSEENEEEVRFNALIDLESNTKQFVKSFNRSDLNDFPKLNIQFLFYGFGAYKQLAPLNKDIEIKPMKFYKKHNFVENDYFEEDAMLIPLHEDIRNEAYDKISKEDILKAKQEKSQSEKNLRELNKKYKTSRHEQPLVEVDLHIHELIDQTTGLSNKEMLDIQMEHFHSKLAEGLKNHQVKKMVFIHGIGAGVLKTELRNTLKRDYPQLYFQDASFKEYGFGATLIIIRR